MGFSHVLPVLAGRWCLHQWWHGELLIVHHHWQHSWPCACSSSKLPWDASLCSKVPIAPMGNADALALILACTTATDTLVNCRGCVLKRPCKVPIAPMRFSCFVLVHAGRRCYHLQRHGELLIVHHHRQYSWLCACSRSKLPIAPMGKMLTRSCFDSRLRNCD